MYFCVKTFQWQSWSSHTFSIFIIIQENFWNIQINSRWDLKLILINRGHRTKFYSFRRTRALKFDKFFIYSQPKDIFTASFELFGRIVFHMATPNPNTQLRMLRGIHSSDCKHTKIFWIPYIIFPFMYKKQRLLKKTREVKKLNNVFQIFTTFYVSKHE